MKGKPEKRFDLTASSQMGSPPLNYHGGKEAYLLTIRALYADDPIVEIQAFQTVLHYMKHNDSVKAIPILEYLIIAFHK